MLKKKSFIRALGLLLFLVLLSGITACGGGSGGKSSAGKSSKASSAVSSEEISSEAESEASEDVTSVLASSKPSTAAPSSKITSSVTTNPGAKTSLTRDEVIAQMPSELRGSTINYFIYTDPKTTVQKDAIAAFERATGITLKVEIANKDQYTSQLAGKISAGNSPDMAFLLENANVGLLKNFQPISNTGFNFNDTAWDAELMKAFTYNGKTYAANLASTPLRNMAVIHYNKKALKKAEMEDPYTLWSKNPKSWTWDKLWAMCDEFLKANRNREGYYGISFGIADAYPRSFGVSFLRYDPAKGQFVTDINEAQTIKRYEALIEATSKNYASATADAASYNMGRILFSYSYSSALEKSSNTSATYWNDFGAVPVPTDSTVYPLFEYYSYGIPVGTMTKGKQAVPYYLRYVMDEKSYNLSSFYVHAEAKKVVDAALARGNFFVGYGYNWEIWDKMTKGTSAQVKSILDSYENTYKETVKNDNETIKNLPK